MKLKDFTNWLDSYLNFEKTREKNIFWLDSMKFLAQKLGNPQDEIPCIHVAGSKGKGSVSVMIANVLEEAGFSCGLYTSPHISDFRERITGAKGFFSDSIYEKAADILVKTVESIPKEEFPGNRNLTWFELVTAYSFLCFKEAKVKFAVYETGLGGRLDSTNIVKPLASVLTKIELEHTEFLGNTIEKIASEKAGIIKQGVPVIIGKQSYKEAEETFLNCIKKYNNKHYKVDNFTKIVKSKIQKNNSLKLILKETESPTSLKTNLKLQGLIQAENAATAYTVIRNIFPNISVKTISKGLSNAFLPGRFEVTNSVVLDGAHTPSSIQNTIQSVKKLFPKKDITLIFACASDKDIEHIIPMFKDSFKKVIFTKPKTVRNANPQRASEIAKENEIQNIVIENLEEAFFTEYNKKTYKSVILVTGSFYLVAEVKELLKTADNKIT